MHSSVTRGAWTRVTIRHSRGVIVGDGNKQINRTRLTFKKVDTNLGQAIGRAPVRKALAKLRDNPGDKNLRKAADGALKSAPLFDRGAQVRTDTGTVRSRERGTTRPSTESATATGVHNCIVLVEGSQGVVIGNNGRMENDFNYSATAELNGRQLLHDSSELRHAVIDAFCGEPNDTNTEMRDSLDAAIDDALNVGAATGSRHYSATWPSWNVVIQDHDGVSIGRSTQTNHISATTAAGAVRPPTITPRSSRE